MAYADVFEAFFLNADVDRDGRISGVEAVQFFRAAALPQATLAKIWEFVNQGQTGFLSRQEFYNALKLATVAQTGRELTPEVVKAALTGPAAAQIPPPRMTPAPPSNFDRTNELPIPQPTPLQAFYDQHYSFQNDLTPNLNIKSQGSVIPASHELSSEEGGVANVHHLQAARASSFGSVAQAGAELRVPRSVDLSVDSCSQQSSTADFSKMNAFQNALDATSNAPRAANAPKFQGGFKSIRPSAGPPKSSSNPELHGFRELSRTNSLVGDMAANCSPRPHSASSTGSLGLSEAPSSVSLASSPGICGYHGRQPGAAAPAPNSPWPKMTPSDVQRFVHVFSQMDIDHDGKVTGEQARQLFLSWQLPREVLRHVWNLSDEDGDSMLSVREFCTAVYLLEKYTEGRPLPSRLPTGILLDEPPTPARKVFASKFPGSGESSWRLPQGSLPPTDFVFEPGPSPAPECYTLSTASARHLQEILFSGEKTLEPASCMPHNSQTPQTNTHLINQDRESEESLTLTLTESDKFVSTQVADLTKHIMSQKEKAEYYRSKLQEIVLFKSQYGSKLAEMTEKLIVLKHEENVLRQQFLEKSKSVSDETQIAAEVSTLKHIQEKQGEHTRALLRLDSESIMSDSHLQARLVHIMADVHELRRILLVRAKSLGVKIKRELPKKTPFGWQPNIQEQAAEWKKGWDTFNDEGFTEVQEYIGPTPEASSLLAISTGEAPAAVSGIVERENDMESDIFNCRVHIHGASQERSLVLESSAGSSAASSVSVNSVATTGAATAKSIHMIAYNDKLRPKTEPSIHSSTVHGAPFAGIEALTGDTVGTHPKNVVESATETLTTAGINTFTINVPPSKSYSGVQSSSEVENSISDASGGNETSWKIGENDHIADSAFRSSTWGLQSNSRSIQTPAEIKASDGRAVRSRGSFEPEDYFDLSLPHALSILAPSSASSTVVNSKHSTNNNKSPADHDSFESFDCLAYTVKKFHDMSPIFTPSTAQPFDIPIPIHHGPNESPKREVTVFDESGSDAASPNAFSKVIDHT